MTLKACLLLFLAGGCGTLSRFLVSTGVNALAGRNLPFGTMAVNILGCFFFGLVWELAANRLLLSDSLRVLLCTGFLGGFTTFSSLIFESFALGQIRPLFLVANIVVQILAGFAAFLCGLHCARLV
ncbi:MAG TPA: CrcB family protein [Candidatus Desulfovibrio intestinipullorum]|uniref:Fluoride-specific ion channel FluC n=1 Tax=Candidatus Desulfovibrio intestinipullorum TaxID=2838536 RepID=A0A9D1TQ78_9BACT|nr:CrcB family protein [Candidatus Desulfovibrio intestinipullorum]